MLVTSLSTFLSVKRLATQSFSAEQLENGELTETEQVVASNTDANGGGSTAGTDVQQVTATTPLQQHQQQLRKRVSMISQHIHFEGLIKICKEGKEETDVEEEDAEGRIGGGE